MSGTPHSTGGATRRDAIIAGSTALGTGSLAGCLGDDSPEQATDSPAPETQPARTTEATQPRQAGDLDAAALQARLDGKVVPASSGHGVLDAIDPESTATPVQDAVDLIKDAERGLDRGIVYLPQGTIEENGSIKNIGSITFLGCGIGATTIRFPEDTHGFIVDENGSFGQLYQMKLQGPGRRANTGSAIKFVNAPFGFSMDQIYFQFWNNRVIHSTGKPYNMRWGKLHLQGNGGRTQVYMENLGPNNTWDLGKINGGPDVGYALKTDGAGTWDIRSLGSGGAFTGVRPPYYFNHTGNGQVNVGHIHVEPANGDPAWPEDPETDSMVKINGPTHINSIDSFEVSDHIVTVATNDFFIGRVNGQKEPRRSKIGVKGKQYDHKKTGVYLGESDEVENRSEGVVRLSCLGDMQRI